MIANLRGEDYSSPLYKCTSMNTFKEACTPGSFWRFRHYMYS